MYNPSITPEAAQDIVEYTLKNSNKKFSFATIEEYVVEDQPKQKLVLYYKVGNVPPFGTSQVEIPLENVIELLSFAMTTIAGAHELTEGYR